MSFINAAREILEEHPADYYMGRFNGPGGSRGMKITKRGPIWTLWLERHSPWRSEIVFEAMDWLVADVAKKDGVRKPAFAFELLIERLFLRVKFFPVTAP